MTHDRDQGVDRAARPRRAVPVTAGIVGAGMVAIALLLGACSGKSSGSGVANVGPAGHTSTAKANAAGSGKDTALAYSQCMRAHGVPKFPDPNADGNLTLNTNSGVDPNSPQFKAADQACASKRPGSNIPPALAGKLRAGNLKYAQCMRSHGIADFPDPKADGGVQIQVTPGSDLVPTNPTFRTADQACRHFQVNLPGEHPILSGGPGGGS